MSDAVQSTGGQTRVVDFDCHVQRRIAIEIQRSVVDQPKFRAIDAEQGRIGSDERKRFGAQCIIRDDDVGDLHAGGQVRTFADRGYLIGQTHRRSFVDVGDR